MISEGTFKRRRIKVRSPRLGFIYSTRKSKKEIVFDHFKQFLTYLPLLIGCLWQLQATSSLYFKYQTVSQITFNIDKCFRPPAITLCYRYNHLVRDPSLFNETTANSIIETSWGLKELVIGCHIRNPVNDFPYYLKRQCLNMSRIISFYKTFRKCFSIIPKVYATKNFKLDFNAIKTTQHWESYIYILHLNPELLRKSEYFHLYLHPKEIYPRGIDMPLYIGANMQEEKTASQLYEISYKVIRNVLLPPPFDTNCLNYTTVNYVSADHCFNKCFYRRSIELFNKVPVTALIKNSSLPFVSYNETRRVKKECNAKCIKKDCKSIRYIPYSLGTTNNKFGIGLQLSMEPQTKTRVQPLMHLSDFLVQVLSILSFWFAFSGITCTQWFKIITNRVAAIYNKTTCNLFRRP